MRKFWAFILLIFTTIVVSAQSFPKTADFAKLEETIRAELKEKKAAGAAVAIISGDKTIFAKGFGAANAETNHAPTADTLFQIGSITKTFTALAILSFAEEGKIRLDAPIGDYAKNLSPKLSKVTLAQLLSHTAGILDEPDEYGGADETMMATYLRSWTDDYGLFEPGQVFSYSNSGFALAGFTLQEAAGKPYVDLMNERVFARLGMTRTTFRPTVAMTYPLAVGHKSGEKLTVVRPLPNDARLYPAGTFYTSVNDLARFAIAFLNDGKLDGKQVFSPAVIKQMSEPRAKMLSAADDTSYGYGLFMNTSRGVRQIWHDGSMTGYSAQMLMIPSERFAVIILSNTDGAVLDKTKEAAIDLYVKRKAKSPFVLKRAYETSDAEMRNLAGVYVQPNRWTSEILIKDGKLFLKQFNREMPLIKTGENRFSFDFPAPGIEQQISFSIGADGLPVALNFYVWAFKKQK